MILGGLAEIRVDKSGGKPAATRTAASTQQEPPQKQPLKPKKHWAVAAAENQRRIDSQRGPSSRSGLYSLREFVDCCWVCVADLPPVQTDGNIPLNQGTYDEAAQSALFQQSVMEWRKARAAAKAKESGGSVSLIDGNDVSNWATVQCFDMCRTTMLGRQWLRTPRSTLARHWMEVARCCKVVTTRQSKAVFSSSRSCNGARIGLEPHQARRPTTVSG